MAYRNDPDLEFLGNVSSADLDALVRILTEDKDGSTRMTEMLTVKDVYKANYPDHHAYWQDIAEEIQLFGANTFASWGRGGQGVLYREVLTDVCDKEKVNYNKRSSVSTIEDNLCMKVLTDSMEKMSREELEEFCRELDLKPERYTPEAVTIALQTLIRLGKFRSYQIAVIVANSVAKALIGRGLPFVANHMLTRMMGIFAGPIGLLLSAGWSMVDIASPAYRVTRPAVIMVAGLRRRNEQATEA